MIDFEKNFVIALTIDESKNDCKWETAIKNYSLLLKLNLTKNSHLLSYQILSFLKPKPTFESTTWSLTSFKICKKKILINNILTSITEMKNKVAIVTASSTGIGKAAVERLG